MKTKAKSSARAPDPTPVDGQGPVSGGTSRREKALETRRRMLKAAYDLFCEQGWSATTMDLIAKRADVAVQTLYFTFNNKARILQECVGGAIIGFDRWDPRAEPAVQADPRKAFAQFHSWFKDFDEAKTQRDALIVFIDASLDIMARITPLWLVMETAAAADPEVRAHGDIGEQRRVEGYQLIVEMLAKRGGLRRGVSIKRGTDILLALMSGELHRQLTFVRKWTQRDCRKWYIDVLEQQLLPESARAADAASS